jgi:hypothetical protein
MWLQPFLACKSGCLVCGGGKSNAVGVEDYEPSREAGMSPLSYWTKKRALHASS